MRRLLTAVVLSLLVLPAVAEAQFPTSTFQNGRLTITTGASGSSFDINCNGNLVNLSGVPQPQFAPCDGVEYITINGQGGGDRIDLFHLRREIFRRLRSVTATLAGGSDSVHGVSGNLFTDVRLVILGGPGRDRISGGVADDVLYGDDTNLTTGKCRRKRCQDRLDYRTSNTPLPFGAGNDQLHGMDGDDLMGYDVTHHPGRGRDLFTAGCGKDRVHSRDGDDIDIVETGEDTTVQRDPFDKVRRGACAPLGLAEKFSNAQILTRAFSKAAVTGAGFFPKNFQAFVLTPQTPTPPTPAPPPPAHLQCADGIDNDADGRIDHSGGDRGCSSAGDNSEAPDPPFQCSDGIDNDGDSAIDYDPGGSFGDPQCESPTDDSEGPSSRPRANTAQTPVGANLVFDLSDPARSVRVDLARAADGLLRQRNRGTCRADTPSRRSKLRKRIRGSLQRYRCTHLVPAGSVIHNGLPAGSNQLPFTGAVNGRPLPPGTYFATITATDAAGVEALPVYASFEISR